MMNKKRTKEIGRTKYLMFFPLAALLMIISNIDSMARTVTKWTDTSEMTDESPTVLSSPQSKATTPFQVTFVDKQGKVIPRVVVQTKMYDKNLSFIAGEDGKVTIDFDMKGLQHASMYATAPDGRKNFFVLSVGKWERTINMDEEQVIPTRDAAPDSNGVYPVVDEMPEFPGGMDAFMQYLSRNIKYPEEAHKKGIQGRVVIQIIVDAEGNVTEPKILQGADPLLDAEAMRITNEMPKWKPGKHEGKAVAVKYTYPIMFRLQ